MSRFPLRARANSSLIQSGVSPCPPASRPFTRRRRRRRSTSRSVLCTERGAVQSCTLRPAFCFTYSASYSEYRKGRYSTIQSCTLRPNFCFPYPAPTSLLSCAPSYILLSLFCFPPPSYNMLLPISYPGYSASYLLLPISAS